MVHSGNLELLFLVNIFSQKRQVRNGTILARSAANGKMSDLASLLATGGRFFRPGNQFFQHGDGVCFQESKHFIQTEDIEQLSELISGLTTSSRGDDGRLWLEFKGDNRTLSAINAAEVRFKSLHIFCCKVCERFFPSNLLLDIHISEYHDTFLRARKERGELVLVCLVESCSEKFKHDKEREEHLVKVHQYPSNFRFNRSRKDHCKMQKGITIELTTDNATAVEHQDEIGKYMANPSFETNFKNLNDKEDVKSEVSSKDAALRKGIPKTINFGRGCSKAFTRGSKAK